MNDWSEDIDWSGCPLVVRRDAQALDPRLRGEERTLGWLNRSCRLAKDFEAILESSRAWVMLAIGFLLLGRVARGGPVTP